MRSEQNLYQIFTFISVKLLCVLLNFIIHVEKIISWHSQWEKSKMLNLSAYLLIYVWCL